jgi:hypothetical protein
MFVGTREAGFFGTGKMAALARKQSVAELRDRPDDFSPERGIHLLIVNLPSHHAGSDDR